MKMLLTCLFILSCSLTIWADLAPLGPDGQPDKNWKHRPYSEKQTKPNGTCMSGILLSIGIFLLGQRLIRKNALSLQVKIPKYSA